MHINDLFLHLEHCETDIFADDPTFHLSGKTVADIQGKFQSDTDGVLKKMYINIGGKTYDSGNQAEIAILNFR